MKRLKSAAKAAADGFLVPALRYLVNQTSPPILRHSTFDEINIRVARECADYVMQHMERAVHFGRTDLLWDHAVANKKVDGIVVEFGVADGKSINHLAKKVAPVTIYGFDSFEGLHVDWAGGGLPKGSFDRGGKPPNVDRNVQLVKGWFDQTLPRFMSQNHLPISLAHIDCDTYEAAKIVLQNIKDAIVPGTILIFDDYFGFRGWKIGVFKAWQETVDAQNIVYEYVGFDNFSVSLRIMARK